MITRSPEAAVGALKRHYNHLSEVGDASEEDGGGALGKEWGYGGEGSVTRNNTWKADAKQAPEVLSRAMPKASF